MHLLVTDPTALPRARVILDAELDAVERAASRFRADSEVCALAAADGAPRLVSPVLGSLIEAALGAARATDGDVDPTVGCAVIRLGYDRSLDGGEPAAPRLTSVAVPVDWTAVEFDGHRVRMPAGTLLDLGATAKAFAADRGAQRIHQETGTGVLVNLGGDIATAGPAPGDGWRVTVGDTVGALDTVGDTVAALDTVGDTLAALDTLAEPVSRVTIGTGTGLATSSTQRRRWHRDGAAHHHIVDPRSGAAAAPVWRTVSVAADTCLGANTVSTAAIVRGRRAPAWIGSLGVAARLVDAAGREITLGGWPAPPGRRAGTA